ncbi:pyridoxamine 5'-phosphate oxidase family protein [Nocardia sp. JMUB6875]|uniref:pyridoxamine 5'-phosphate oxidase family protein n=1 Tax=Nocardia sp. JMUB6875 TaxID=3158170 RepID=UPI0032E5781E
MIYKPEPESNSNLMVRRSGVREPEPLEARALPDAECLRLLAQARFGRIAYSRYALPAIRPVNHLIDEEMIIVGTGAGVGIPQYQQVVAYEADSLDPDSQQGWCVIVTGTAEQITDPNQLAHYHQLLQPRLPGGQEKVLCIHPEVITGVEYLPAPDHWPSQ